MSLVPYLVDELLRDSYDPFSRLYDQHFGLGLLNDELRHRPVHHHGVSPYSSMYVRPFRHLHPHESGSSTVVDQKDQFKVNLDVQQFKPEEINVKVADGYLVVDGKHEEKRDKHGFVSRQFTRRYKLPENVNLDVIQSNLSSDGILSITAPKKLQQNSSNEIPIPVIQTNQPAIKQTKPAEASAGAGDKMES